MNMQKKNEEEFIHSPRESTGSRAAADCSECDNRNRRRCLRQLNPVSSCGPVPFPSSEQLTFDTGGNKRILKSPICIFSRKKRKKRNPINKGLTIVTRKINRMRETPNLRTEENERRKIRRERKEEKMKFRRRKDRKIVQIRVLLLFASAAREFGPKD
jgi:hypothetical protein